MHFSRHLSVPAAALVLSAATALVPVLIGPALMSPATAGTAPSTTAHLGTLQKGAAQTSTAQARAVQTGASASSASMLQATAPRAAALPTTGYHRSFTGAGKTSTYHVYADGLDRSKAVGVLYYLGGDYTSVKETWVHNPGGTHLTAMAAEARKKNMVLVVPISPDTDTSGNGMTWWEEADGNGDWFRALQAGLTSNYGLDASRTWLAGYSGGAEFLTYELLADRQGWLQGGGATIIGGGGSDGMQTAPSAAVRSLSLTWFVGSKDVAGSTTPATWSASATAAQGRQRYVRDGFTRTRLTTLPGLSHDDYDIVGLISKGLATLPPAPATSSPSSLLRGAIRADYLATGGAATYGQPTSAEKPTGVHGGVYQGFTKNCTYYWSPQTGAHPVRWGTGIGNAYRAADLERGWGYPVIAERALANGAYQDFHRGTARFRAIYSPRTGTHAVKLSGGIGTAWQKAGHEHGWGFPTTEEYAVNGGVAQEFSNGWVATWHRATGKVTVAKG
ncbi:LGFP repeat-containing protein [Kocuria salsicia]|uniref:LGFP repeat-containing protein n=1 Tax=Kocuria salsicia TaxID=664639 RepID=UPI0021B535F8|nr:hypothetical protein [Kocuria salsicia]